MNFIYQAVDRKGRRVRGELCLPTRQDALRQLQRQGLTPLSLEVKRRNLGSRRRLKAEELNMAIHELATMLAAGVSMADAVEAQERGARHPKLITALQAMANGLRQGQSFPVVLESAGLDLPRYVYQLVAAGEMTGNLAGALRDCATQMEYERRTRAELQGALIYPAILVLSGVLAVATLFVFVVPKLPWSESPRMCGPASPCRQRWRSARRSRPSVRAWCGLERPPGSSRRCCRAWRRSMERPGRRE